MVARRLQGCSSTRERICGVMPREKKKAFLDVLSLHDWGTTRVEVLVACMTRGVSICILFARVRGSGLQIWVAMPCGLEDGEREGFSVYSLRCCIRPTTAIGSVVRKSAALCYDHLIFTLLHKAHSRSQSRSPHNDAPCGHGSRGVYPA